MSYTYVKSPTPQEIEDHIRAARAARARAIRSLVMNAVHWVAHPHLKARTA